jgi:hypothetical protein
MSNKVFTPLDDIDPNYYEEENKGEEITTLTKDAEEVKKKTAAEKNSLLLREKEKRQLPQPPTPKQNSKPVTSVSNVKSTQNAVNATGISKESVKTLLAKTEAERINGSKILKHFSDKANGGTRVAAAKKWFANLTDEQWELMFFMCKKCDLASKQSERMLENMKNWDKAFENSAPQTSTKKGIEKICALVLDKTKDPTANIGWAVFVQAFNERIVDIAVDIAFLSPVAQAPVHSRMPYMVMGHAFALNLLYFRTQNVLSCMELCEASVTDLRGFYEANSKDPAQLRNFESMLSAGIMKNEGIKKFTTETKIENFSLTIMETVNMTQAQQIVGAFAVTYDKIFQTVDARLDRLAGKEIKAIADYLINPVLAYSVLAGQPDKVPLGENLAPAEAKDKAWFKAYHRNMQYFSACVRTLKRAVKGGNKNQGPKRDTSKWILN